MALCRAADRSARRTRRCIPAAAAIVALFAFTGGIGFAAEAPGIAGDTRLFLDRQVLALPGDVEITVGEPDPRVNLAQCLHYEPFIPSGTRLWGRTTLGVHCVDGATWNLFLPVQIKVFAPSPVAARPIARGQLLGPDDVRIERVELTRWAPGTLATAEELDGRLATRPIACRRAAAHATSLRASPDRRAGRPGQESSTAAGASTVSAEGRSLTLGERPGQAVQAAHRRRQGPLRHCPAGQGSWSSAEHRFRVPDRGIVFRTRCR
jgi:flagella basal body P-ring formation protein FlgA